MCLVAFVFGNMFGKFSKNLNPFKMFLGIFILGPSIAFIIGFDKWYLSTSLIVGFVVVFGNPFRFLGSIWTDATMGFKLEKAKSRARKREEGGNRARDDLHRHEREAEERLKKQKADIEEELHRQKTEAEEELHRQTEERAEDLRRREEAFKQEQTRAYRESVNRQDVKKETRLDPERLNDAYKILGVVPGLSLREYKQVWLGLVQKYHPDKTAHLGKELQRVALEETVRINKAWETVKRSF